MTSDSPAVPRSYVNLDRVLKRTLTVASPNGLLARVYARFRAIFRSRHNRDKGFKGGFFQRFDGRYDRDCMTLDYTPETLAQVVRNFMQWAASTPGASPMDAIKLDRQPLPEAVLDAARRLSSTYTDPLGWAVASRALAPSA